MKHKILLIFCIITLSISFSAFAERDAKGLFYEANTYYENGDYKKAIELYESIIDSGYESGALYYNLGGAYFKDGELGYSILNYEKAKNIMPRDADLNANYKFVESRITGGKILPAKSIWNWRPLKAYSESFTKNEITLFASGAYLVIMALLITAVIKTDIRRNIFIITGILVVFVAMNIAVLYNKAANIKGVTIASETEALFGPFDSGTKFFTLYEGMTAEIIKEKDDWYKVRREDGKAGWVKKDTVAKI